ncbi:MAG TPA: hypothetical protein VKB79_20800 [Bryobacteraceae bacterium]|nr:hypothetical protein [Bryobacteraceae bacterium]
MFSRRGFLSRASAGAGWFAVCANELFAASDFWNKKEPADWTPQEVETLKTKSPWAKKVHGEGGGGNSGPSSMNRSGSAGTFGGMSGAESNGIGGGGGGRGGGGSRGGGGGDRDFGPGAAAAQGPEVIIRWESAAPVLGATKFQLPAPLAEHYAVSITGVPPAQLAMAVAGRGGMGRGRNPEGEQAPAPSDPQAEAKARQERLLHAVTLTAKGHDPQNPDVVLQTADKETLIFGFLKSSLPLTANDKDVEFAMRAGFTVYKAKFQPKEMLYKGALSV